MEIEFTGQDHHIGKLAVVTERFAVRDAQLRGDMYFQAEPPRFRDSCDVRSDYGAHARFPGRLQRLPHRSEVFVVEGYVERQVAAESVFPADIAYRLEVFRCEIVGGVRTHVEVADAEIHGVGTALDGGLQAFEIACGGHDLQLVIFHDG